MIIRPLFLLFLFIASIRLHAQTEQCLYQVSTISALAKAYYDGEANFSELLKHGNFGLGTFNKLDGEMVCLDGKIYQITSDGNIKLASDTTKTPFSVITNFIPQKKYVLKRSTDLHQLETILDSVLGTKNLIAAIKISGKFESIKTRSVKAQKKPYPLLVDAVKEQVVFDYQKTEGNLIGFRFPDAMEGVNVSGYHLHYLSTNKKEGGHLINCNISDVVIEIELIHNFQMLFPTDEIYLNMDLKKASQSHIHKIEKQQ